MPELRALFEQARDAIPPPPDALRSLVERRRVRRRNQRLGVAVVALLVAGTGISLGIRAFMSPQARPSESPPAPTRMGSVNPQVTATIEVGEHPLGLAVGDGAVWAITQPSEGTSELVRIDLATNAVEARAPYIGHPLEIAAGAGAVWGVRTSEGPDELLRIDPRTLEVTSRLPVADHVGSLTAGTEGVWLILRNEDSPPSLARLDPESGEVVSEVPLAGLDHVIGLELARGSVWLRGWEDPSRARGCARVMRVDPAANAIVQDLTIQGPVQAGAGGLRFASGSGAVWVNCREQREQLFAVGTDADGEVGPPLTLPHGVFWPIGASVDGVWFAGFDTSDRPLLGLLDPLSGEVIASVEIGTLSVESAVYHPATDSIWVPDSRGTADSLLRIDVRP